MAEQLDVHQAEAHLSELLARVARGEEIVIADAGRPVARIVPFERTRRRVPGTAKDEVKVMSDFDAPLPDTILKEFEA